MDLLAKIVVIISIIAFILFVIGYATNYYDENKEKVNQILFNISILLVIALVIFLFNL